MPATVAFVPASVRPVFANSASKLVMSTDALEDVIGGTANVDLCAAPLGSPYSTWESSEDGVNVAVPALTTNEQSSSA